MVAVIVVAVVVVVVVAVAVIVTINARMYIGDSVTFSAMPLHPVPFRYVQCSEGTRWSQKGYFIL